MKSAKPCVHRTVNGGLFKLPAFESGSAPRARLAGTMEGIGALWTRHVGLRRWNRHKRVAEPLRPARGLGFLGIEHDEARTDEEQVMHDPSLHSWAQGSTRRAWRHEDKQEGTLAGAAPQDRRLLAGRQLSVRRAESISATIPPAASRCKPRHVKPACRRPLGHHARARISSTSTSTASSTSSN